MNHFVNGNSIKPPFPEECEQIVFALGCFWGAERQFWQQKGVYTTAVGYIGGHTKNPIYKEVCTGLTGHAEAVLVVYDPEIIAFSQLLPVFYNAHNPTQGMRQGNDIGTQYRSGIYTFTDLQQSVAEFAKRLYDKELAEAGLPKITTEILPATEFYYAEEYHQQYLAKNPDGYCGLGGLNVKYHETSNTPYFHIGGEPAIRLLVDKFYFYMDSLPEAQGIRAIHQADLSSANSKLFKFLSGWLGGPNLFMEEFGHPMLRARHFPFSIGESERDQWMLCMNKALDEIPMNPILHTNIQNALQELATHMINTND